MKKFTKLLSLLLAALMVASLTISAFADGHPSVVRIQISGDVGSMAPWAPDGNGRTNVFPEIYETLFYQETLGGDPVPLLAKGYDEISETEYRIYLNENIHDSQGNPINANDVVYSYMTCTAEGNQKPYVGNIESITVEDDYTINLKLIAAGVGALQDAVCSVRIVSEKAYTDDKMGTVPVGTGPYVLKEWVTGATITLVKNENYWGDGNRAMISQANCDEIVYKVITESSQIMIALQNGEIDYTSAISQADISHFLEGGDLADQYRVKYQPATLAQVLFFNCSEGNPFSDVRMRHAVSYAIDNEAVLEGAYEGRGAVSHAFAGEKSGDYQAKWKTEDYYEYNPEKAKELVKEAGYDKGLKVRLICDALPTHVMMAQIIQLYLGQIGIEVEINSYDDALFNTYRYDPTQWDLHINNKAGAFVVQQWQYSLDARLFGGATCNFLVDEHWQQLYETASALSTHTPENLDAAWQYLKEIDPVYSICFSYDYFVGTKLFDTFYLTDKDFIIPGACVYAD